MEQDLNDFCNTDNNENYYFKLEYKDQDVFKLPKFQKWYSEALQYVKKQNINGREKLLSISFCNKCLSYVICSSALQFSTYKCNNCNSYFCLGCLKEISRDTGGAEETFCLKGYLKSLYLRIIYKRSDLPAISPLFAFLHILFCLFITPLYLGFLSYVFGFYVHRKNPKKKGHDDIDQIIMLLIMIYGAFRGLFMFPYIILFLPFMIILLIPGIFSYNYYLYIYNMYNTAFIGGNSRYDGDLN